MINDLEKLIVVKNKVRLWGEKFGFINININMKKKISLNAAKMQKQKFVMDKAY